MKPCKVGSERKNKDGTISVKTDKRWNNGTVKWESKHRLIWIAANGEIPSDKKINFIDGDNQNLTLENLQLVDLNYQSEKTKQSRFKKGVQVWNAGLKGWQAGGNSINTQFKKGNKPKNTKYNGAERISKDGYVEMRISENKWVLKHRYIYEQHHKVKLESNQYVSFIDGNKTNLDINNLQLISRAEMMLKNTIHQYPTELKESIKLVNKVNKIINEKYKH